MNYGFKLYIHNDLSAQEKIEATRLLDMFFINSNGQYGCRRKSGAYMRRGILGYNDGKSNVVIRRMVSTRRIFAAIPKSLIDKYNNVEWNQCMCAEHRGGQKIKVPFILSDYELYFEDGVDHG